MNIQYDINSETGLMNLKFKNNILDPIGNNKEIFEKYILAMLAMNDKFVLTGSLSLKLLGIEPIDNIGDFDFGLLDTFTEEEYQSLKDFFQLTDVAHGYQNHPDQKIPKFPLFNSKAHMWQFSKLWEEESIVDVEVNTFWSFQLDIFNDEMLRKKDIITIYYNDFPIKLIHPSITLSYRMRYALDVRTSTTFKYWEKMKTFMDNAKSYYQQIRLIQKMVMRVHEHNVNTEGNKNKIEHIRNLVNTREYNFENFFDKVFPETPPPDQLPILPFPFRT